MPGIDKTMKEYSEGRLHSGSKKGPVVKSRAQAIAIGLSEARKAGENVKPKHHSFASSDAPHGAASMGKPEQHHIEQGHKTMAGRHSEVDGAGRKGHDESGHRSYSEHKAPTHPSGNNPSGLDNSTHHPNAHGAGAFGYPGKVMELDHDGGHHLGQGEDSHKGMMPAVLKHEPYGAGQGPTAGHPGMHAGMGSKAHGFGHAAHQRHGNLRMSGHPGGHRIGKR